MLGAGDSGLENATAFAILQFREGNDAAFSWQLSSELAFIFRGHGPFSLFLVLNQTIYAHANHPIPSISVFQNSWRKLSSFICHQRQPHDCAGEIRPETIRCQPFVVSYLMYVTGYWSKYSNRILCLGSKWNSLRSGRHLNKTGNSSTLVYVVCYKGSNTEI